MSAEPGRATGDRGGGFRRATAGMALGTVASRVTGFGRVFALAYALGFFRLTDTYNLANTTPNIVYELILGGVLSATLVPVFVDHLATRDEDDAWPAISAVATVAAALLVALTVAFFLSAPWIIRLYTFRVHGQTARDQQAVATALLRMFAPQVLFYGLITVVTALLNARRRFVAPAVTPVLNNLLVIAVLLVLPHELHAKTLAGIRHDAGALVLLGLGTTAGVAVQALALLPSLARAGLRLRLRWAPRDPAVRRVIALSGWTFGYVVANQVALWVLLVLANQHQGDVSAFQAAYLFFLVPHSVLAVSVMTALLPDLSERWAVGDREGFRGRLGFGLRLTGLVMLPAAAGYVVLARPLIDLVLRHGALTAGSAATTADVLVLFAVGLPAFSAYLLLMRAYQAMQDARTMFFVYVVENALNVVAAVALYPSLGVQGLALSVSIAYLGGTALAVWDLRRRAGGIEGRAVLRSLVRIAVASAVMTAGAFLTSRAVGGETGVRLLLRVGAAIGVGVSLFVVAARSVGVTELADLVRTRRKPA